MKYLFDGFNWFMRLDRGDRLSKAFETFFVETKCSGAWVSGVGAVEEIELGFYDIDKKVYQWQTFNEGPYELTGLQGSIALSETSKPMFHLHGTISGRDYHAYGGHIKDLVAAATLELFIHRSQQPLTRKTSPELGMQMLDL